MTLDHAVFDLGQRDARALALRGLEAQQLDDEILVLGSVLGDALLEDVAELRPEQVVGEIVFLLGLSDQVLE